MARHLATTRDLTALQVFTSGKHERAAERFGSGRAYLRPGRHVEGGEHVWSAVPVGVCTAYALVGGEHKRCDIPLRDHAEGSVPHRNKYGSWPAKQMVFDLDQYSKGLHL